MLSEEQYILIDKFFSDELSAEETQQFQELLRDDVFRTEVELQQQIVNGISVFGAKELKTELAAIHNEVNGEINNYKPSQGAGGGAWSAIKLIIAAGAIGAAAYFGYKYYTENKEQIHHKLEELDKVGQPPAQPSGTVRHDTVWHTIKTVRKDTVIYGDEAMKEYMKTQQPGAAEHKVIIKRDTLIQSQ